MPKVPFDGPPLRSTPEPRGQPACIADHQLIRCIGRGSYGEVWLARNVMGTYRAIKIVHRSTFDSDRPYEREFEGIQKFEPLSRTHESQVDVLQVGRDNKAGYFYYIMELADDRDTGQQIDPEYYEPKTLRSEMKQRGRLPFDECVPIGAALATALGHLHRNGLIHRDIKPSNIIFINGSAKLADIGLVASTDATCSFVGTEGYFPPEGPTGAAADIYSLGKVLYEISTGKDRHDFPEFPTEPNEDEDNFLELNAVLLKACHPEVERRYQSAQQLHADLLLLQAGKSVRRAHKNEQRVRFLTRFAAACALSLLIAIVGYLLATQQTRRARRAEAAALESSRQAYLAQAQALRWSGRAGRRFQSLEALRKAALIRPGSDLRDEAIASMTLVDVRIGRELGPVTAGTVGIDSRFERFAQCDGEGNLVIRRIDNGKELARLPGAAINSFSVLFTPDGRMVSGRFHPRNTVYPNWFVLWDLSTGEQYLRLTNCHGRHAFTPDSSRVAFYEHPKGIFVYGLATRTLLQEFPMKLSAPSLAYSPDGQELAVCDIVSTELKILDAATGAARHMLKHPQPLYCPMWDNKGTRLVAPCADGKVYLWESKTGRLLFVLDAHRSAVTDAFFNEEGNLLATIGWDAHLRLWNLGTRQRLLELPARSPVGQFSPDNRWLGVAEHRGKLALIELDRAEEFTVLTTQPIMSPNYSNYFSNASISADGRLLASGSRAGVVLWDLPNRREVARLPIGLTWNAIFDPKGAGLLTSGRAGFFRWPITSATGEPGKLWIGPPHRIIQGDIFGRMGISPGGEWLAVNHNNERVWILNLSDSQAPREIPLDPNTSSGASMCPSSRWLATGNWRGSHVAVYDIATTSLITNIHAPDSSQVSFSPDERWLVVNTKNSYQFWRTGEWHPAHEVLKDGVGKLPKPIVFSRDAKLMAVQYGSSALQLVEVASGRVLTSLEHANMVPLCFSPDDRLLVSADLDGNLQIWDLYRIRKRLAAMNLDLDHPFPDRVSEQASLTPLQALVLDHQPQTAIAP